MDMALKFPWTFSEKVPCHKGIWGHMSCVLRVWGHDLKLKWHLEKILEINKNNFKLYLTRSIKKNNKNSILLYKKGMSWFNKL